MLLPDLLPLTAKAVEAADSLLAKAKAAVFAKVAKDGKVSAALVEKEQFAAHGLAWAAQPMWRRCASLPPMPRAWTGEGRFGEFEALIVQTAFGEYLTQMTGGIPMSQGETVRPQDLGPSDEDAAAFRTDRREDAAPPATRWRRAPGSPN